MSTPSEPRSKEQPLPPANLPVPAETPAGPPTQASPSDAIIRTAAAGERVTDAPRRRPSWKEVGRPLLSQDDLGYFPRRRRLIPILLFIPTFVSTFGL